MCFFSELALCRSN